MSDDFKLAVECLDLLTSDNIDRGKINKLIRKILNGDNGYISYFNDRNLIKYRILRRAVNGFNGTKFSLDQIKKISKIIEGKNVEFLSKAEVSLFEARILLKGMK